MRDPKFYEHLENYIHRQCEDGAVDATSYTNVITDTPNSSGYIQSGNTEKLSLQVSTQNGELKK